MSIASGLILVLVLLILILILILSRLILILVLVPVDHLILLTTIFISRNPGIQ